MNFSFKDQKLKEYFYIIIIFIVSISVNQYYGNIGVYPIDSFLFFDSGFRFLNGQFPFKDVWTFSGPLIDLIQVLVDRVILLRYLKREYICS